MTFRGSSTLGEFLDKGVVLDVQVSARKQVESNSIFFLGGETTSILALTVRSINFTLILSTGKTLTTDNYHIFEAANRSLRNISEIIGGLRISSTIVGNIRNSLAQQLEIFVCNLHCDQLLFEIVFRFRSQRK